MQGLRFSVQAVGIGVEGFRYRISVRGVWIRAEGLGLRVQGLGFRVKGLGFRV